MYWCSTRKFSLENHIKNNCVFNPNPATPPAENNKKRSNLLVSLWGKSVGTSWYPSAVGYIWKEKVCGVLICRSVMEDDETLELCSCVSSQDSCLMGAGIWCVSPAGGRGVRQGPECSQPLRVWDKCTGSRWCWSSCCVSRVTGLCRCSQAPGRPWQDEQDSSSCGSCAVAPLLFPSSCFSHLQFTRCTACGEKYFLSNSLPGFSKLKVKLCASSHFLLFDAKLKIYLLGSKLHLIHLTQVTAENIFLSFCVS